MNQVVEFTRRRLQALDNEIQKLLSACVHNRDFRK
jgi:hypothetical protein